MPRPKVSRRSITVNIEQPLFDQLVKMADADHRSLTNMLECLIRDEVLRREPTYAKSA